MKNNYPIRYVALPLSEDGTWKSDIDYVHGIICFLVIKCYVVGEESDYYREGDIHKQYKVVPTYDTFLPNNFEISEPKYDIFGMCMCNNYLYTKNVFETLEEAQKYRDERNKDIADIVVANAPKWAKLKEKFEKTLEIYSEAEELFEKNTEHLPTDDSKRRKQSMYGVDEQNGLIDEDMSVYSLIEDNAYSDFFYAVYTISEEEAKKLDKILENDEKADAFTPDMAKMFMHTPLMMHSVDAKFVKLFLQDNKSQYVMLGDEPYVTDEHKTSYSGISFGQIFFTQETSKDIVESYNLDEKRAFTLRLKVKPKDIWINDKYKY